MALIWFIINCIYITHLYILQFVNIPVGDTTGRRYSFRCKFYFWNEFHLLLLFRWNNLPILSIWSFLLKQVHFNILVLLICQVSLRHIQDGKNGNNWIFPQMFFKAYLRHTNSLHPSNWNLSPKCSQSSSASPVQIRSLRFSPDPQVLEQSAQSLQRP